MINPQGAIAGMLPVTLAMPAAGAEDECRRAHWRINGFGATLMVWTAEAWERLAERPTDAQYVDCGIWCALRMDD